MSAAATPSQRAVFRELLAVIVGVIDEEGDQGVPGGTIYVALMRLGCTLAQYEDIMAALVSAGRVRKRGHLYLPSAPTPARDVRAGERWAFTEHRSQAEIPDEPQ